jgi:16S rRNA processing protein RimM
VTAETLEIGYIAGPHGVRGEVRIRLHAPDSDALEHIDQIRVVPRTGPTRTLTFESLRPNKREWLACFAEVPDRTAAEALAGATVHVPLDALPPLDEGEFYLDSVIGYAVVDAQAGRLGVIRGIMTTTVDMFSVADEQDRELLVPLLDGVVQEIDDEARVVHVELPEGLLD